MNVSDRIWHHVAEYGVKHVFFLPGGGAMHLNDALIRQQRITPVSMLHEQACGIAADAYAQYTGNIGVVCVTSGPGGTNLVTPVTAAWIDSTPLLVISGQVSRDQIAVNERQRGPQEAPITKIVQPITKLAHVLMDPRHTDFWMHTLIKLALTNQSGPVWLDVPLDVQSTQL